jgi:hypothetical protein
MKGWWQPLVGVGVGWILGLSTEWWRQNRRAQRYREAIYIELRDVHSTVKTRIEIMKQMLTSYITEGNIKSFIADIKYYIFQSHFAEISLRFTESERLALVHIYTLKPYAFASGEINML